MSRIFNDTNSTKLGKYHEPCESLSRTNWEQRFFTGKQQYHVVGDPPGFPSPKHVMMENDVRPKT